jgi:Arc/MetJ-type ribon-helix-helix transcriptional regulator
MTQINMKIPDSVISDLDQYVEHTRYNSRAALIRSILLEWIEQRKTIPAGGLENTVDIPCENTADKGTLSAVRRFQR